MAMTAMLATSVLFPDCNGCLHNLYMTSSGKVCNDIQCNVVSTYQFPLEKGQSICFKDTDGNILELMIENSYLRERYDLMYLTSDYIVKTDSYYRCKSTSECNYDKDCKIGTIGNKFVSNSSNKTVSGYGCIMDVSACDTLCLRSTACVFYYWKIEQVGHIAKVYKHDLSIWEVKISIKYKDIYRTYLLNLNNPSINLDNDILENRIPIYIINNMMSTTRDYKFLLEDNNTVYAVTASDINMPQNGIIGDFQMSVKGSDETMDANVICSSNHCQSYCYNNIPSLRRFRNTKHPSEFGLNYKKLADNSVIELVRDTHSFSTIMISNVNIKNLQIIPAQCKINLLMTFACDQCGIRPYIILKCSSIKKTGALPFESNCTFIRNFLSCTPEIYKLELLSHDQYCTILIPSLNQTLNINFEFLYYGGLDFYQSILSRKDSNLEEIKDMLSSPGFWDSIKWTVATFTSIGIISNVILRIITMIEFRRSVQNTVEQI
uniref:Glycoprotein n=1 Tax=Phasmaviridae sp. TaxID=2809670 RepID=A0A8G0QW79_9VIRU|nr:MAG: glycoprotein precursor [Phasmaviridae sp.]